MLRYRDTQAEKRLSGAGDRVLPFCLSSSRHRRSALIHKSAQSWQSYSTPADA